jgi:peptidoglycan/LPS O-acetylase OafA/YrhL
VRALAALGVVVYHCANGSGFLERTTDDSQFWGSMIENLGNFCVSVFFLLSGLLLFREFAGWILFDARRSAYPSYLERRMLRIYPAYWIALGAFVLVIGTDRVNGGAFGLITLTERHMNTTKIFPGIPASWTLVIEVAFYVFLPIYSVVLALITRGRRFRTRLITVTASLLGLALLAHLWIGIVLANNRGDLRLQMNLPTFLGWFALGMALAVLLLLRDRGYRIPTALRTLADHPWVCWSSALVLYLLVVAIRTSALSNTPPRETIAQLQGRILLQGIAAFMVLLPIVLGTRDSRLSTFVGNRRLAWIGVVSYGVYLWHQTCIAEVKKFVDFSGNLIDWIGLMAIVLPASILIGWISFRLVEKPVMSLVKPRLKVPT